MRMLIGLCAATFLSYASPAFSGQEQLCGGSPDAALVLAMDVSKSIGAEEYLRQIYGYAESFRNPSVITAITSGLSGCIVVTMTQWGSFAEQDIAWSALHDEQSSFVFADALERLRRPFRGQTAIGVALAYGASLFKQLPFEVERRIIDISGDGPNNTGIDAALIRNLAVEDGIIINGLPLAKMIIVRDSETLAPGLMDLEAYYASDVIGGPGSFLVLADNFPTFSAALVHKLVREIAWAQ